VRQGELKQDGVVGGVVGGGVARTQDPSQRLPTPIAAIQVGQERVEPEGVLVAAGRALLPVGVGIHQRGIKVKDEPAGRGGSGPPHPRPGGGAGGSQARQAGLAGPRELLDHSPGGRDRGHRPKERLVPAKQAQVAEAVATVGEHHDQIAQHLGWLVTACPAAARAASCSSAWVSPIRSANSASSPIPAWLTSCSSATPTA
jgi:hypothetical protein